MPEEKWSCESSQLSVLDHETLGTTERGAVALYCSEGVLLKMRQHALPGEGAEGKARCPPVIQVALLVRLNYRVWQSCAVLQRQSNRRMCIFTLKVPYFTSSAPAPAALPPSVFLSVLIYTFQLIVH